MAKKARTKKMRGREYRMETLTFRDIRCFHSKKHVPLRPLTFLVGENSTGKSTFLATLNIFHTSIQRETLPTRMRREERDIFNEEPFLLGAYSQIAHRKNNTTAKHFEIGSSLRVLGKNDKEDVKVNTTFEDSAGTPKITNIVVESKDYSINVSRRSFVKFSIHAPSRKIEITFEKDVAKLPLVVLFNIAKTRLLERKRRKPRSSLHSLYKSKGEINSKRDRERLWDMFGCYESIAYGSDIFPIAPIRTKPSRIYDIMNDAPDVEGGNIPRTIAKAYYRDTKKYRELKCELENFGKSCGLFDGINIKPLGKKSQKNIPFQLELKIKRAHANLSDVGYGISQILPILVESVYKNYGVYLIQQPEIHLHPRAQAEFGTLLGKLAKDGKKQFVVETHSEYIVDRIRADVCDKKKKTIAPDDVLILFFEQVDGDAKIHPIKIDKMGNLIGAPKSFREFFLEERERFILRGD